MVIGGKWRKNIDINMQQTNCTTLDSENTEYRHLLRVNSKYVAACVVLEMGNCISHNVFRITTHSRQFVSSVVEESGRTNIKLKCDVYTITAVSYFVGWEFVRIVIDLSVNIYVNYYNMLIHSMDRAIQRVQSRNDSFAGELLVASGKQLGGTPDNFSIDREETSKVTTVTQLDFSLAHLQKTIVVMMKSRTDDATGD